MQYFTSMMSGQVARPIAQQLRACAYFLRLDRWWWVLLLLLSMLAGHAAAPESQGQQPPARQTILVRAAALQPAATAV